MFTTMSEFQHFPVFDPIEFRMFRWMSSSYPSINMDRLVASPHAHLNRIPYLNTAARHDRIN